MGIRFYCPNGHKLNVKPFQAGQTGICPHCGAKMQIPLESTRPSSKAANASSGGTSDESSSGDDQPLTPSPSHLLTPSSSPPQPLEVTQTPDPLTEAGDAVWYVRPASGGQFGPANRQLMRTWLDEGRIGSDSLVWREGWRDWKEADEVFPELGPGAISTLAVTANPAPSLGAGRTRRSRRSGRDQAWIIVLLILALVALGLVLVFVLYGPLGGAAALPAEPGSPVGYALAYRSVGHAGIYHFLPELLC